MTKHVHCELIKAWADGAQIQLKMDDGNWEDIHGAPAWKPGWRYRIKPKLPAYKVRFLIYQPYRAYYEHVCANVRNKEDEKLWENDPRFIKWITDWVEYDV